MATSPRRCVSPREPWRRRLPSVRIPRAILAGLLASACAEVQVDLYEGPARDRSQIAVVRRPAYGGVTVFRIDDYDTRGYEWHVMPGSHRVWIELRQYGDAMNVTYSAWMFCSIDFEAEAGGTYQVLSESGRRTAALDTEVTLGVSMVGADGERVEISECTHRRPSFD